MYISNRFSLVAISALCLGITACSSAPKNIDMLEQARADYNQASTDATVVKHAPEQLDQAQEALTEAVSRWKKKQDRWKVEHYAYVAKQRVETARLMSERKEADRQIEDIADQRNQLSLRLREAELAEVRLEAEALKRRMAALQAQQTERGMVLTLGDVLFDVNQATLAPGAARNIAQIASFMRKDSDIQALIEGHTDSMGEDDYNYDLALKRSSAVRDALIDAGVAPSRISIHSFGENVPVASNDSAAGRQSNRRVEVIFPDSDVEISNFEDF